MNVYALSHHTKRQRKSTIQLLVLMLFLLIYVGGCTTSRLWDGSSRNMCEITNYVIPASIDNIYLSNSNTLIVQYKLTDFMNNTSHMSLIPANSNGNLLLKGKEYFKEYHEDYSFEVLYQIVNGPVELRLNSISLILTGNHLSNTPWMERQLDRIAYLKYSTEGSANFLNKLDAINYQYFLDLDIAFVVPDNFIHIDPIQDDYKEVLAQIDDNNKKLIMSYYRFAKQFVNSRTGNYIDDMKYIKSDYTIQPLGWLLSNGQITTSLKDITNAQVAGVAVTRRNIDNRLESVKIAFNDLGQKENIQHYRSRILVGSGSQSTPYNGNAYPYKLFVNDNYTIEWNKKPLFTKPHDYSLTLEFHDDVTERITWPTPVKILLTPLTVSADVVLTPLFAGVAYLMESMPR